MPTETEHKFLLNSLPKMGDFPRDSRPTFSTITQVYLANNEPGACERVRSRWYRPSDRQSGRHDYRHTLKRPIGLGSNDEVERPITKAEYDKLIERAKPDCVPIKKSRGVFQWDGGLWEYDEFINGVGLLEIEVDKLVEDLALPPFLDVGPEVTGDALYSNAVMARKSWANGFPTRADFMEAWRTQLRRDLGAHGLAFEFLADDFTHKEWWMVDRKWNIWVRLRDMCETTDDDFHLSCWAGQKTGGDDYSLLAFWHGAQADHSVISLSKTIMDYLTSREALPESAAS